MKLTLNIFVAFYLTSWMISVIVFENFQLINISFLLVSIVALLLIFAVKRKKLFKVSKTTESVGYLRQANKQNIRVGAK